MRLPTPSRRQTGALRVAGGRLRLPVAAALALAAAAPAFSAPGAVDRPELPREAATVETATPQTPPGETALRGKPEDVLKRVELTAPPVGVVGSGYRTISGKTYVLGAYDELQVNVLSTRPQKWDAVLTPQGTITLPLVGTVRCAGLSVADLGKQLTEAFARYLRHFTLTVTVTRLRGIEVTVVGQVKAPGPYSLGGLTRLWEAVQRSGGITEAGSIRSVRLTRGDGRQKTLDLYPFLFSGREESNVVLESGDTVYVPVAERIVGLSGEVRRPGLYEFGADETLGQLLALAGGPTAQVALDKAYLVRSRPDQTKDIIRLKMDGAAPAGGAQDLRDGDLVVLPPLGLYLGQVRVLGEVRAPGLYERKQNMRLSDLLDLAGGCKASAALSRAYIERYQEHEKRRNLYVDAAAALHGDPQANPLLEEGDVVHVPDISTFLGKVSVSGEFRAITAAPVAASRAPGGGGGEGEQGLEKRTGADVRRGLTTELQFDLVEGMRLSDLARLAGGPTATAALDRGRLVRIKPDGMKEALAVDLRAVAGHPGGEADLALRDGDSLQLPSISVVQKRVRVVGEVVGTGIFESGKRRGIYELKEGDTVRDLVLAVGGVTANAAPRAARIERQRPDGQVERIPVDLRRLLDEKDDKANVVLQNGDELVVPEIADLVYVVGAVNRPGAFEYRETTNRVLDMLVQASGNNGRAILRDVRVYRADKGLDQKPVHVDMNAIMRRGRLDRDPRVRPGDVVYVPEKPVIMQDILQTLANVSLLRFYAGR